MRCCCSGTRCHVNSVPAPTVLGVRLPRGISESVCVCVCVCMSEACVYLFEARPRAWPGFPYSAPPCTSYAIHFHLVPLSKAPTHLSPSAALLLTADTLHPTSTSSSLVTLSPSAYLAPPIFGHRSSLARLGAFALRDLGNPLSFIFLFLTSPL